MRSGLVGRSLDAHRVGGDFCLVMALMAFDVQNIACDEVVVFLGRRSGAVGHAEPVLVDDRIDRVADRLQIGIVRIGLTVRLILDDWAHLALCRAKRDIERHLGSIRLRLLLQGEQAFHFLDVDRRVTHSPFNDIEQPARCRLGCRNCVHSLVSSLQNVGHRLHDKPLGDLFRHRTPPVSDLASERRAQP